MLSAGTVLIYNLRVSSGRLIGVKTGKTGFLCWTYAFEEGKKIMHVSKAVLLKG